MPPRGPPGGRSGPGPAPRVPGAVGLRGEAQDDPVPESPDLGREGAQVPVLPAGRDRGEAGMRGFQLDEQRRAVSMGDVGESDVEGRSPYGEAEHDVRLEPTVRANVSTRW